MSAKGIWRGVSDRITANRVIGLKRAGLTREQINEIQSSTSTGQELSARLGVSKQLISNARNQRMAYVRQAVGSPWGGLMP